MKNQDTHRIRRLPREVVGRIAAGEMISRPSAAVKELIENALDAGAQQITIEVTEAIDHFLRVSDDGHGIARESLGLALERYSTSKIAKEQDLLAVETLGFRGEALASIAEISKVTLISRTAADEHAWEIHAEAGHIGPVKAAPRAPGTSVTVEDLFFNTPVRKRFLKKGSVEIRLSRAALSAYAIATPGIGWRMQVDGKWLVDFSPSTDLRSRLLQIHGTRLQDGLLEVNWREKELALRGFVGVPELARAGTQHQTFFVNGRWVAAPWIGQAVRHGYGDLLPGHLNPWVVLFLVMPADQLDVNLHPTKREVRFLNERWVFGCVQRAVNQAVARLLPRFFLGDSPGKGIGRQRSAAVDPATGKTGALGVRGAPARGRWPDTSDGAVGEAQQPYGSSGFDGLKEAARLYAARTGSAEDGTTVAGPSAGTSPADNTGVVDQVDMTGGKPADGLVSLWQLHKRYVLAQTRKGLLIIDQHAAHERILYEKIRHRMVQGEAAGQQLLFPVVLELDETQADLFRESQASLARMGFDIEEFGEQSVLVRGVPPLWRARSEAELLRDLLDEAGSMNLREGETVEGLARSFACRAAIKSGEPLSVEEMNQLVDELFATQRPHGDPHGRPTFIFIPLQDLDRRFGRSGGVL
ncbi:MAG: DNA mismatch repair endonuclease MutL [Candidatus Eisenbacteria sp.]|nr:DNA mismatch repair endonuclease MutL [Candidatus Eisenbacteria bacterium]